MYKYKGVQIRSETVIGIDAPRTNYLIVTDDVTQEFEETIFHIFRKVNVVEYKNPHDSLNWRIIHKICGYAHFLIGSAEHEHDISDDQVTISIFRSVKNHELFKKMSARGNLTKTENPGIYHVRGISNLPFQIVITIVLEG